MLVSKLLLYFRRNDARVRLANARRHGEGVHTAEWLLRGGEPNAVAEQVLEWCRQTLAGTRRPWGISEFDLALSFRDAASRRPRTLRIPASSPASLYVEDSGLGAQVRHFLAEAAGRAAAGPVLVAGALCSWGEVAHAALVR